MILSFRILLSVFFLAVIAAPVPGAQPGEALVRVDKVVVDKKTEIIIEGALKYLASRQAPTGFFQGVTTDEKRHPISMTGYCLMAFQAAGHLPDEGEFGKNVSMAMQYLLDSMHPDGVMGNREDDKYMYSHGVATIALAELYGQTRSTQIRPKLERAVKLILSSQSNVRGPDYGGWRYKPVVNDADISVTVLQVVALRAAKNGGLDVPQKTIDEAVMYVKNCADPGGGFLYRPQEKGKGPGFARTAAAIYSLQVCGLYDDPLVKKGSDYLLSNKEQRLWFTYGNFYAAPAQYMIGGETWEKWYGYTRDVLLKAVSRQGELAWWESKLDEGRGNVGPLYCTAVYAMILAMPYHYIPLYQR